MISDEVVETGGTGAVGPDSPGREGHARVGGGRSRGRSREEPSFVARTRVATTVEPIVRREPIARNEEPYFVAHIGVMTFEFLGGRNGATTDNTVPPNGEEREDIWG